MRWNGDSTLFAAVRYYRCVPQRITRGRPITENREVDFLGRKMGGCLPGGRVRRCGSRPRGWPERGASDPGKRPGTLRLRSPILIRRVSGPGPQRLGARFCRAARNLSRRGLTRTGELGGRVVAGGRTSQCQLPQWHTPGARGPRQPGSPRCVHRLDAHITAASKGICEDRPKWPLHARDITLVTPQSHANTLGR